MMYKTQLQEVKLSRGLYIHYLLHEQSNYQLAFNAKQTLQELGGLKHLLLVHLSVGQLGLNRAGQFSRFQLGSFTCLQTTRMLCSGGLEAVVCVGLETVQAGPCHSHPLAGFCSSLFLWQPDRFSREAFGCKAFGVLCQKLAQYFICHILLFKASYNANSNSRNGVQTPTQDRATKSYCNGSGYNYRKIGQLFCKLLWYSSYFNHRINIC